MQFFTNPIKNVKNYEAQEKCRKWGQEREHHNGNGGGQCRSGDIEPSTTAAQKATTAFLFFSNLKDMVVKMVLNVFNS